MNWQMCVERQRYLNVYVSETAGRDFSFQILSWDGISDHHDHPIHRHSHFEVCFVVEGEGMYEESGIEYAVSENTLFISRPGLWHKISSKQGIRLIWVAFEITPHQAANVPSDMLPEVLESNRISLKDADDSTSMMIWTCLLLQADPKKRHLHEQLPSMAHALLISFFQQFSASVELPLSEPPQLFADHIHSQLIYRVKRFIHDNLSQTIRLQDIAAYFNVSERQFIRLFHSEIGENFTAYVRKERIKQSKSIMQTTLLSLKEVAEVSGFASIHHFTTVFKQETGETPGHYRKRIGIN